MTTNWIIDAHEDLAYESLYGKFDYTRSVRENRENYRGPEEFLSMIGWPELRQAKVGVIFGTIFLAPPDAAEDTNVRGETTYQTSAEFHDAVQRQLDFYDRLAGEHPALYRRIFSGADFQALVRERETPGNTDEHPIGLVTLLEGAEGLRSWEDLSLYYERGVRLIGPVWGGGRWCAGTRSRDIPDQLTADGRQLLERMEKIGFALDISHMKNRSALEALDAYDGTVVASHANCNALLPEFPFERQLNDETIRALIEHDGVMGVIPYTRFLSTAIARGEKLPREAVTLDTLSEHIDHICQLAGNSRHAAFGSDADGGFGYPQIPYEMNDISDLPKIAEPLRKRGYTEEDLANIFHGNWQRILERILK